VKEGEEHWGMNDQGEDSSKYAGVGAWHVGSYDPELDLIYYGTSNPSPWFDWAPPEDGRNGHLRKNGVGARPGDNLYSSSVLALRPDTGELVWYHQEHPHDDWDYDATLGEFVLVNAGGKKLMIHQAKSGFVFVYDRTNGKIENVWTINKYVTFVKTIDPKTGELIERNPPSIDKDNMFCPSMLGGRSWNAGSYNPETKVWFNSRQEMCEIAKPRPEKPVMEPLPAG
jgi:glucose dehydrogenase